MFLVNSRLGLFIATPFCSTRRGFTYSGRSFSRSYGAILPSSLTRVISSALGYSPRLPVSVCGTVTCRLARGYFLAGGLNQSAVFRRILRPYDPRFSCLPDLPGLTLSRLSPGSLQPSIPIHQGTDLSFCVTPLLITSLGGTGIFNLFPISYAFRPRLRDRLTLGGLTFPRKP